LCAKAEQAEAKRATCHKNLGKPLATLFRILALLELNSLPFPLISDARKQIARVHGVWAERPEGGMGGRFQTERTTFVIAPGGRIKTILRNVDPYTHDRLLLEALYS